MSIYTIYEPPIRVRDPVGRAEELVFLKDGFSWPALLFSLFWLAYQRMWLILCLFGGTMILLFFVLNALSSSAAALVIFGAILMFALEANTIRRMKLEQSGYRLSAVINGKSLYDCERKYFALLESNWQSAPLSDEDIPGTIAAAGSL